MTKATSISRIAAVAASVAMFASMSFAIAPAHAQTAADLQAQISSLLATIQSLQAQLNGTQGTMASVTFATDLTIGSTGSDVTALQTWLIAKGFSIPAGATGYFGAQTQAAVAAYQAANGITPAAGYFGPITRAKVNAAAATTTTTTTTTTTGTTTSGSTTLSGGEATLSNFNLNGGAGTVHEGDTGIQLAQAQFDVQDGDVNVQRVDIELQAKNATLDTHPWKYFTSVSVYDGSTKLGTVDASQSSDWSDNLDDAEHAGTADVYRLSITGLNDIVKEGTTNHQLTIVADANSTLDSVTETPESFYVDVPDQGIRAVDAEGIQQYTGSVSDTVTVGFSTADNGNITVSEDTSDPATGIVVVNSSNETQSVPVFAFNLRNTNNGATQIDDLVVTVATTSGSAQLSSVVRNAVITVNGNSYTGDIASGATNTITFRNVNFQVPGNSSVVGSLKVDLASQSGNYSTGQNLIFSLTAANVTAEGASSGDTLTTGSGNLTGTATGKVQTLALSGIAVVPDSASVTNSPAASGVKAYNTYTIKFDVSAVQNDAYIPNTATSSASTTAGAIYTLSGSAFSGAQSASLSSTADTSSPGFFKVPEGSTRTFTLTVVLTPTTSTSGLYEVDLTKIQFDTTATTTPTQSYTVDSTNSGFKTNPTYAAN